jgi:Adenylylsulphate kinase
MSSDRSSCLAGLSVEVRCIRLCPVGLRQIGQLRRLTGQLHARILLLPLNLKKLGIEILAEGEWAYNPKSTLARDLRDALLKPGYRTVSRLDGDLVRRLLSARLTFSQVDRDLNIARIGYVADGLEPA